MARRFVKRFTLQSSYRNPVEEQINDYAEFNNLTIVTITAMDYDLFALFEEKEGD